MRVLLPTLVALLAIASSAPATPLACAANCTVTASSVTGYVNPVLEIVSGAVVTWHVTDVAHIERDGPTVPAGAPCLNAASGLGSDASVRFDIVGGALYATQIGGEDGTVRCASATALPGGSFLLPYACALHPTMRAALVVSA
jgi:hypothetical protein